MANEEFGSAIIALLAETHVHSGIGQSTGALDLPIAREQTTHYPFVPGSGVKGAFRVWASEERVGLTEDIDRLFGPNGQAQSDTGSDLGAGSLLCSDARLLLLPVRCLSDAFKWVTCPAILKRFKRDCDRAGVRCAVSIGPVEKGQYFGQKASSGYLGLEEREFEFGGDIDGSVVPTIASITGESVATMEAKLVVISDDDFTWFARFAVPVMARNVLQGETKISKNLWYEESLSPDTLMYLVLAERKLGAVRKITTAISSERANYIQIGGNETIGQGWFRMIRHTGA